MTWLIVAVLVLLLPAYLHAGWALTTYLIARRNRNRIEAEVIDLGHEAARAVEREKPNRCTGACCDEFFMPITPEELANPLVVARIGDGEFIADMVTPVRFGKSDPERTVPGANPDLEGWFYSCRHWDRETGNCTVYEQRPRMCREYPYGRACEKRGCTFRS